LTRHHHPWLPPRLLCRVRERRHAVLHEHQDASHRYLEQDDAGDAELAAL
jgi:hypothetical protein